MGAAAGKADGLFEKDDYRGALGLFQSIPEAYGSDLPEVAEAIREKRGALERKVSEKAQGEIARAQRAIQKKQEREALSILRQSWDRYRGYPAADEILKLERQTFILRFKVATAEAEGNVRKTDLEVVQALEAGVEVLPSRPDFKAGVADRVRAYREILARYQAGMDQLWCTRKEYDVRKALLDQAVAREERILEAGR